MNPTGPHVPAFLRALQITDSFFPVGGFAYSAGLETATDAGRVHDVATLGAWIDHFLDAVFVPLEGRALAQTMTALESGDPGRVRQIDRELTAICPSREARRASTAVGKRVLGVYGRISDDSDFAGLSGQMPEANAATAYGVVFFHAGLGIRDAIAAFGYGKITGIVSAAIRLMAFGQEQGQQLLTLKLGLLPPAAENIVATIDQPLSSFGPGLDIEQMNHQYVYSRLFRS
jgi:urease accessory protein